MNTTNSGAQTARQAPSPTSSLVSGQTSMIGGMSSNVMAPLPMGHQQDLNFLYRQMQELGEILKSNRDKVNGITKAAEEVMVWRPLGEQVSFADITSAEPCYYKWC